MTEMLPSMCRISTRQYVDRIKRRRKVIAGSTFAKETCPMNELVINGYRAADQSSREALRAHVEQLSLEMQREFVNIAMKLLATRPAPCEVEIVDTDPSHMAMRRRLIQH
jgi:hypothetical protein